MREYLVKKDFKEVSFFKLFKWYTYLILFFPFPVSIYLVYRFYEFDFDILLLFEYEQFFIWAVIIVSGYVQLVRKTFTFYVNEVYLEDDIFYLSLYGIRKQKTIAIPNKHFDLELVETGYRHKTLALNFMNGEEKVFQQQIGIGTWQHEDLLNLYEHFKRSRGLTPHYESHWRQFSYNDYNPIQNILIGIGTVAFFAVVIFLVVYFSDI